MLRIAHISDLHIRAADLENEKLSLVQATAKFVLAKVGVNVEAGGHDPNKLIALAARLKALRPHVIVVTGDLTNFGDAESFDIAGQYLTKLKSDTGAERILCVPGNHDCLVERAALAKQEGHRFGRTLLWLIAKLNRETEVMREGARRQFYDTKWRPAASATLLENYHRFCKEHAFDACDPAQPVELDAKWGTVSFFLFNSVNGPGLMANKGAIGAPQLVKFGVLVQDASWRRHEKAIRVALLHHHPISAPQSRDADVNRAYDWMDDGPRLLNVLNSHKFHFVLHGHQHEPFTCAVDYGGADFRQTLIVAAGSASQKTHSAQSGSFNLIDLISPFEARIRRFDYGDTGFATDPTVDRIFPLAALEDVRLGDSSGAPTVEDWALQSLVRNSFRDFERTGEAFAYDELIFDVVITTEHQYKARYRRKGKLMDAAGALGPIFTISGSPPMNSAAMQLAAIDHLDNASELGAPTIVHDEPNYKVVQVRPRNALSIGDVFDVELSFMWQASQQEPNHFDAVSLMGFRHPVSRLAYRVSVPWRASQIRLQTINTAVEQIRGVSPTGLKLSDDQWQYGFELVDPPPVGYLFRFSK